MGLEAAILWVYLTYPAVLCGPYLCGAYDTCWIMDDRGVACETVLRGDE